jgi:ribonuclease HII
VSKIPLKEIEKEALGQGSAEKALEYLKQRLEGDERAAARNLLAKFGKKVSRENGEIQRLEKLLVYEKEAWNKGFKFVAGVDEAGRGPLAGPVVAAAVVLAPGTVFTGLDDSKKLTAEKREELFPLIREKALSVAVGKASVEEIDKINIYRASRLAMERAVEALAQMPDCLLTDAMPLPKFSPIPVKPIIHGDSKSASIAAASIIAKVTRDKLMAELHQKYPLYGFSGHKGYGTELHLAALKTHGPCPEHRLTFGPVAELLAQKAPGGPFGYWKEKLTRAQNFFELKQAGLQIKRLAVGQLSEDQLEDLRELFREKREQWKNEKA